MRGSLGRWDTIEITRPNTIWEGAVSAFVRCDCVVHLLACLTPPAVSLADASTLPGPVIETDLPPRRDGVRAGGAAVLPSNWRRAIGKRRTRRSSCSGCGAGRASSRPGTPSPMPRPSIAGRSGRSAPPCPGMDFCELFPQQARIAQASGLVRSLHHTMSSHNDGSIEVLTGKTPTDRRPDLDRAVRASRLRHGRQPVPRLAAATACRSTSASREPPFMTRPTYLGLSHQGFAAGDPSAAGYAPPDLTSPAA